MTVRVRVYRNLHRQCWSVVGPEGRVIDRPTSLLLRDCRLVVRPGGRARALRERKKCVHAFAVGTIDEGPPPEGLTPITYNPFRNESFVTQASGQPVRESECVYLSAEGKAFARIPSIKE